jgi:hypothetical protein
LPTDFYGIPFWLKYDEIISGPHKCHYNRPSYGKAIDHLKYIFNRLTSNESSQLPYFLINFFAYYTHDNLVVPSGFDLELVQLLKEWLDSGRLDDTLFIFITDHGSRLSDYYIETEQGQTERSMPFLSIKLPKYLQEIEKYQQTLVNNSNNLINAFDIHQTLKHFLEIQKLNKNIDALKEYSYKNDFNFKSLLTPINSDRTCIEAQIPNVYCDCQQSIPLNEETLLIDTNGLFGFEDALAIIKDQINLKTKSFENICSRFEVESILNSKRTYFKTSPRRNEESGGIFYVFKVKFQQGNAIFQATLKFNDNKLQVYGKIIRVNRYGELGHCIKEKSLELMPYCVCT